MAMLSISWQPAEQHVKFFFFPLVCFTVVQRALFEKNNYRKAVNNTTVFWEHKKVLHHLQLSVVASSLYFIFLQVGEDVLLSSIFYTLIG